MKNKYLLLCISVFCSVVATAQTKEDTEKIIRSYDLEKIKAKEIELRDKQLARKQKALALAKINNWSEFIRNSNGTTDELMSVTPDGFPIYYSNNNLNAARATRANHLNAGGSMGLSLDGQGMVARVWDGGTVRRTHNGFTNRVTTVDDAGTTYNFHATHVTGTIIAINIAPGNNTKGMASQATARTFNWDSDESEALSEVQGGMILSNHSYGVPVTNQTTGVTLPAWFIGAYTETSREWDEIAYLSPYYLPVMSAGNDGTNNNNATPIAAGYDKLTTNKTAKNLLIVANANDATIAADGTLTAVTINTSSSQGPTDDRRIKPDITGNGTNVTSLLETSNTATGSLTGTSMSSPNVTGTLLLVQQHSKNITGGFMKAATLKGLACHTADDAGNPGPDAKFGWGLLNAKKAVETLNQNGLQSWVSEETLSQGQVFTKTVSTVGGTPLIASITWTDVAGVARVDTSPVNDVTPVLVNDLDIRITRSAVTSFPWKLQANPALNAVRDADNNVDNVERINIDAPVAGDYTITVTHKGNLVNNLQNFSLVITGISSGFAINPTSDNLTVCDNQNAVFNFAYKQIGPGTTNFSAVGLPAGATASFNNNSLSADGTVVMTVSGLTNVAAGEYTIGVQATNGTETEIRNRTLRVYKTTFQNTILTTPVNNLNPAATTLQLNWNKDVNAESYRVEVATDNTFTTIVSTSVVVDNYKVLNGLSQETRHYWRVFPINRCGQGTNPTVFVFTTGKYTCGANNYSATDFSNATIGTVINSFASVPIVVPDNIVIGDLNVVLQVTHTWIGDMIISLKGPAAIGSPEIILLSQPCAGANPTYPNIQATLDDSGVVHGCSATAPVVSGTIKPFENLSNFNGLSAQGTWTLNVHDVGANDGGNINAVALNFCKMEPALSISDNVFNKMAIYPNPTKGLLNINLNTLLEGETVYTMYDIQGRRIMHKSSNNTSETLNIENFTNGVYMLSIENGNNKTTKKIVLNK